MIKNKLSYFAVYLFCTLLITGCSSITDKANKPAKKQRSVMFIGVDISESFQRSGNYEDSFKFLAHYIYSHMRGYGGLEIPGELFIGSIGGATKDEAKTFIPVDQTMRKLGVNGIEAMLKREFPKGIKNPHTDFNAYFEQIASYVKDRKLILRPINIIMVSDGVPDVEGYTGKLKDKEYDSLRLKPLENLSRNVTIRLLYTKATVGKKWREDVKRRRVKIWTQDAKVMKDWRNPMILQKGVPISKQTELHKWIKKNVDFMVRAQRV